MCHMLCVTRHQGLTISINNSCSIFGQSFWNNPIFGWVFGFGACIIIFFSQTNGWSHSVKGLLSTGLLYLVSVSPLQARTSGLGTFLDFSLRNLSFPFLLQIWTFIFAVSKAVTSPSLTVTPLSSQSQSARQELIQNAAWMRDKYYQRTGGQGLTSKPRGTRGGMAALSGNLGKLVRLVVLWDPGAAGWLLAHPGLTGARKTAAFMEDRGSRPESKAGNWTLEIGLTVGMRYVKLRG